MRSKPTPKVILVESSRGSMMPAQKRRLDLSSLGVKLSTCVNNSH